MRCACLGALRTLVAQSRVVSSGTRRVVSSLSVWHRLDHVGVVRWVVVVVVLLLLLMMMMMMLLGDEWESWRRMGELVEE